MKKSEETLTLKEYAQAVKEALEKMEYEYVSVQDITGNNGQNRCAVTIMEGSMNVAPAIYLEEFYKEYLNRGFSGSVNSIIETYEMNKIKEYVNFEFLTVYKRVRQWLTLRLINYERNRELLEKVPHIRYLDLAVVFQCFIMKGDGYASILVKNDLYKIWMIPLDALFRDAMFNLEQNICLNPLADEINMLVGMDFLKQEDGNICSMHILSNVSHFYGACSLLSKNALKDFADSMNSRNVFIIPFCVHEVMLLTAEKHDIKVLKGMVKVIKQSGAVKESDFLSDNIYIYDRDTGTISIA